MTSQNDVFYRKNSDVLVEALSFSGSCVLDVGCGDGGLTRFMSRKGAQVIGVEPNARQLERARASTSAGSETYIGGGAEALPVAECAVDTVVFFNSFHHVPVAVQGAALAEAARVLKPGGVLCLCEPMASGSYFEVVRRVDDETDVRAAAYVQIGGAARYGFAQITEEVYTVAVVHADFNAFHAAIVAASPSRAAVFDQHEAEIRATFDRAGVPSQIGVRFDQPMRINLLRLVTAH